MRKANTETPQTPDDARLQRRKSRVAATLRVLLRTRITAGLLVVLPLWVTILLIRFLFGVMRDASQWVVIALLETKWFQEDVLALTLPEGKQFDVQDYMNTHPSVDWGIAIFSVFVTISVLYAIGLFTKNIVGRKAIDTFEHFLDRVPLVKTVYRSSKQILATFAGEQSQEFQRAALIPFPQEKMRSVGFITAIFNDSVTGEELATVFIPTTPNPTTGYLQVLKRKDLVELDWSVEDAVQTIMSAGILRPDFLTIVPGVHAGRDSGAPSLPEVASRPEG